MTEFIVPLQGVFAREYARPPTVGNTKRGRFPLISLVGPFGNSIDLDLPPCAVPTSFEGYPADSLGFPEPPFGPYFSTTSGLQGFPNDLGATPGAQWEVGGAVTDNGARSPLMWQDGTARMAGAVQAQINAAVTQMIGKVEYLDVGFAIGAFVNTQSGDSTTPSYNIPATLQRLAEQLSAAGGGQCDVSLASSAVPILVTGCGAAFVRCDGAAFIAPGDIGPNPGQLPLTAAENTGAVWRQHPSTFVRQTNAIRGFQQPALTPFRIFVSIDVPSGPPGNVSPLRIFEVTRAPTHSRWLFWIDSEQHDVIIAHPAGSDLRRPRDVFSQVIAPALQTREGVGAPLPTFQQQQQIGPPPFTFGQIGNLRHFKYLQAATFVCPLDALGIPKVSIPQNGGINNN